MTVSGGSAGATNSVAAGATLEGDYARELNVVEDLIALFCVGNC